MDADRLNRVLAFMQDEFPTEGDLAISLYNLLEDEYTRGWVMGHDEGAGATYEDVE